MFNHPSKHCTICASFRDCQPSSTISFVSSCRSELLDLEQLRGRRQYAKGPFRSGSRGCYSILFRATNTLSCVIFIRPHLSNCEVNTTPSIRASHPLGQRVDKYPLQSTCLTTICLYWSYNTAYTVKPYASVSYASLLQLQPALLHLYLGVRDDIRSGFFSGARTIGCGLRTARTIFSKAKNGCSLVGS